MTTDTYPPIDPQQAEEYKTSALTSSELNGWEKDAMSHISTRIAAGWKTSAKQEILWWKLKEKMEKGEVTASQPKHKGAQFHKLVAFLEEAAPKLQRPALYLWGLRIRKAGPYSAYPDSYTVSSSDGSIYYGSIAHPSHHFTAEGGGKDMAVVLEKLEKLNSSPENCIAEARLQDEISACIFCNRTLTDAPSIYAGYGPTCANNYSLPWGAVGDEEEVWEEEEEGEKK